MRKPVRDFDRTYRGVLIERLTDGHLSGLLNVKPSDIRGRAIRFGTMAKRQGAKYWRREEVIRIDTEETAANVAASIRVIAGKLLGVRRHEVEK